MPWIWGLVNPAASPGISANLLIVVWHCGWSRSENPLGSLDLRRVRLLVACRPCSTSRKCLHRRLKPFSKRAACTYISWCKFMPNNFVMVGTLFMSIQQGHHLGMTPFFRSSRNIRVGVTVGHQCEYGLVTPDAHGKPVAAKKPTKFASSSVHMLRRLGKKCTGSHPHQPLLGGRAANAAFLKWQ